MKCKLLWPTEEFETIKGWKNEARHDVVIIQFCLFNPMSIIMRHMIISRMMTKLTIDHIKVTKELEMTLRHDGTANCHNCLCNQINKLYEKMVANSP